MSDADADWERFRGKVALVTGASAGIGRAVAQALLARGLSVVGCARRRDRLEAIGRGGDGERFLALSVDLRDEAAILQMFETLRDRFGGVDVLVNNAGLGHHAPLVSGSTEHFREMLDVNVLALCICTREALRDMRARGDDGHVIHVSSMAAYRVPQGGGSAVYAATKHAVRALTEGLRAELRALGSRIRVSAISPGFVETEFAGLYHKRPEAAVETYGRYKVLEPTDIARAVEYVLLCPPHVQVHDVLMRPVDQPD
jgi:17beta-estradiol 17-dehydrogenase / 3beta-hydroxysteroid 3-dehydrogenase